ncbi:TIR domain-containing protein [uncultured Kriegella sp.]|uniref:Lcl C-terminal domain-containing protein n=1 Tax=uncultured Kriegella sp. TaxID=1798910 RepID=UPI0030DB8714|tara:strand:+ start:325031 stop:327715 length:2685 start_codon:yes stop_codon:yes gene_type:complete
MHRKRNIFLIYASQDNELLLYLLDYLKPLEEKFNVAIWHDDPIYPEQQWKPKNASRLNESDIFLLLISNAFMHSEFIKQDVFKMIIEQNRAGKSMTIPLLLDDCLWDIDFEFDNYNFSLKELEVLPVGEKPIRDWNSADLAFIQVVDYLKKVIPSIAGSADRIKTKKKTLTIKKIEQIALNFSEEKDVNVINQGDKGFREEAEGDTRVEEERKVKEEVKVKKEVAEKGRDEIAEPERKSEQEKRLGEDIATQRRVIKRNRLTGYNYRFKTGKVAEAKEVTIEEKWEDEETKAQIRVALKSRDEIAKSGSESEQQKRLREDVALQERAIRKNRLSVYNYRFKIAKSVEVKEVPVEENRDNEAVKAKKEVVEESRYEIVESEDRIKPGKSQVEDVTVQGRVIRKKRLSAYNYRFKSAKAVGAKEIPVAEKWDNEAVKAKKEVVEESRYEIVKPEIETKSGEKLREVVAMFKGVMKKTGIAIASVFQYKNAKAVGAKEIPVAENGENEAVKTKKEVVGENRYELAKSEIETKSREKLREVVAMFKGVMKKTGSVIGSVFRFKSIKAIEAKEVPVAENSGNEEAKVESESDFGKKLEEVVAMFKGVMKKTGSAIGSVLQFKGVKAVEVKEVPVAEDLGNEEAKVESESNFGKKLEEVVEILKRVVEKANFFVRNYQFKSATDTPSDPKKNKNIIEKRKIRLVFFMAALVTCSLLIYIFSGNSEKESSNSPEIEATEVDSEKESTNLSEIEAGGVASETATETTIDTEEQGESFSKLAIGDTYAGGIVFAIDQSGKKGKVAYHKDAGPMPWKNAMSIHEQLGEGWRLPTLNELRLLYRTIGQGAANTGQFADKLYWSATSYDANQARLLRFSDGNTSFHYNKKVAHRRFHVRAIRDFEQ